MKWLWFFLSLRGRIGRKPYWIYTLSMLGGAFLVVFIASLVDEFTTGVDLEFIFGGYLLLTFWPTLSINVKRWHDRNRTAWWFALLFLGGLGFLVAIWILVECLFFTGSEGSNRFGPAADAGLRPEGELDRFQFGLVALLISLTILATCFTSYRLPAGSMMPTLLVGDFILVNRTSYGVPMPFTNRQVMTLNSPKRGDVVVFRYPKEPSVEYIKRVVGIPGDRIEYYDKILHVNDKPYEQIPVGVYVDKGVGASMSGADERIEMLEDIKHKILIFSDAASVEGEYIVQDGEYFVMGDNRDNSNDSRYWGAVPEENLLGKAFLVIFSLDPISEESKFERVGMKIQ